MSKIKYYFMIDRWKSFGIYIIKSFLKKVDNSGYPPEVHEVEQYMYRYLRCKDCMKAGECVKSDCGCKMPARAHVTTDFCPTMRWGPMLNEKGWDNYKKKQQIKFILKQKKDV